MTMRQLIEWLELNAEAEDLIPGVVFVEGHGRFNSDWNVTDKSKLEAHIVAQG